MPRKRKKFEVAPGVAGVTIPPELLDQLVKGLVVENLPASHRDDPAKFFGEENWKLFRHAVNFRNLIVHECTLFGQDKFPSLIGATETVLRLLATANRVPGAKKLQDRDRNRA